MSDNGKAVSPEEAIAGCLRQIAATGEAVRVATSGIVTAGGKGMRAPGLGDLVLQVMGHQGVALQLIGLLIRHLQGGFVLSDAEASRVADLVVERMKGKADGPTA